MNNISYEPTSNHIIDVSYDASGRIVDDGIRTYTYNSAGRIERIQAGAVGVFNAYNPFGQRIQKNSGEVKTYFVYDESGLLIGEYDQTNNPIREYVYLDGQPIALFSDEKPNEVLNIHTDHLGTPRAVSNASNEILWRIEGDQFGDVQPSIEQVTLPLRHAGQYEDNETGLFYNWHRFYDPAMGRYITSDPIGLAGGTNPYVYVSGSPLWFVDPKGLIKWDAFYGEAGSGLGYLGPGGKIMHFVFKSPCINDKKVTVNVIATGLGVSGGIDPDISLGVGKTEFYDDNEDTINPNVFNGVFSYIGVSHFFSSADTYPVQVGNARGDLTTKWSKGLHTDFISLEAVMGISVVVGNPRWESCCAN